MITTRFAHSSSQHNDIDFGDDIQEIVGEEGDYTEDEEGEEELDENE